MLKRIRYILILIVILFICFLSFSGISQVKASDIQNFTIQADKEKHFSSSAISFLLKNNQFLKSLQLSDNLYPIHIHWNDTQASSLFTPLGDATPELNSDGSWEDIRMTDDRQGQVGGLVLDIPYGSAYTEGYGNAPAIMDISFDIRINTTSGQQPGNGFAIFNVPEIIHGETYKDGSPLAGKNVPKMPKDQGMFALGQAGGNLGAGDMLGVSGGYITTNKPDRGIPGNPDTLYGSPLHAWGPSTDQQIYNDIYESNLPTKLQSPASMYQMMTWPDNDVLDTILWKKHAPGSLFYEDYDSYGNQPVAIKQNILDGNWYTVNYKFDANSTFTMTLSDAKTKTQIASCSKNMADDMSCYALNVYRKAYLKITATTGLGVAKQYIRNLHGSIDVAEAGATISRKVDSTGKPLENISQNFQDTEAHTITNPVQFTKADGSHWILSHINTEVVKTDGSVVTKKRVPADHNQITNINGNWSYNIPNIDSNNIAIRNVDFVYRRSDGTPRPQITLQKNGTGPETDMVRLDAGESVKVNATINNPNDGPSPWQKVTALIVKPSQLMLSEPDSDVSEENSTTLKANFGNLLPNKTKTISYILKNMGSSPVNFYAGDVGKEAGVNLGQIIYIYDQSSENVDVSGHPVQSSYYYVNTTLDAPNSTIKQVPDLNSYINLYPSNYVPRSGLAVIKTGRVEFHYWDIDDPNSNVSMDPSQIKVPTKEINNFGPIRVSGPTGEVVSENLPADTEIVKQNGSAPAPKFKNYQYLGYYKYDGINSRFYPYDPHDILGTNSNVETLFSSDNDQTISFIYRRKSLAGKLTIRLNSKQLDFGHHFTYDIVNGKNLDSVNSYQVQVIDARNNRNLKLAPTTGDYKLYLYSDTPLIGKNKVDHNIQSQLDFEKPNAESDSNLNLVTLFPAKSTLSLGNSSMPLLVAENPQYGNLILNWPKQQIHLKILEKDILEDKYESKITWQLTNSLE
ncbi:WxL domain-containing protein [Bombilactobacillus bombi]|nr:WxL domain-containing protein [Bombilactobacillus bombi]